MIPTLRLFLTKNISPNKNFYVREIKITFVFDFEFILFIRVCVVKVPKEKKVKRFYTFFNSYIFNTTFFPIDSKSFLENFHSSEKHNTIVLSIIISPKQHSGI